MDHQDRPVSGRPLDSFSFTGSPGPLGQSEFRPWNPLLLLVLSIIMPVIGMFVVARNWKRFGRNDYFERTTVISVGLLLMMGCFTFALPSFASSALRNIGDIGFAVPILVVAYLLTLIMYTSLSLQISAWWRARADATTLVSYRYPWKAHLAVVGILLAIPYLLLTSQLNAEIGASPAAVAQRSAEATRTASAEWLSLRESGVISLAEAQDGQTRVLLSYDTRVFRERPPETGNCYEGFTCMIVLRAILDPRMTINVGIRPLARGENRNEAIEERSQEVERLDENRVILSSIPFDNPEFSGSMYLSTGDESTLVQYAYWAYFDQLIAVELVWDRALSQPFDDEDADLGVEANAILNDMLRGLSVDFTG